MWRTQSAWWLGKRTNIESVLEVGAHSQLVVRSGLRWDRNIHVRHESEYRSIYGVALLGDTEHAKHRNLFLLAAQFPGKGIVVGINNCVVDINLLKYCMPST
jgi:hypothetical protein